MAVSLPPEIQRLQHIALFKGLTDAQLVETVKAARRRKFGKDEYLYMQGDLADAFYVLIEGRIKMSQVTVEGQQVILRYVAPGEAFGIIAAISEAEYPASAETVDDSEVLAWDQAVIRGLMVKIPAIALQALKIQATRIREFQDRLRELSTERVERRIARALLRLARQTGKKTNEGVLIDMPLSRQDLAQMTGTTLFTVSRTLSQWESKGLIKSSREKVIIAFPHGLVSIAEDLPLPGSDEEDRL